MDSQQIRSFYMGKNSPERKDYIMENLVVTEEESASAQPLDSSSKVQPA